MSFQNYYFSVFHFEKLDVKSLIEYIKIKTIDETKKILKLEKYNVKKFKIRNYIINENQKHL